MSADAHEGPRTLATSRFVSPRWAVQIKAARVQIGSATNGHKSCCFRFVFCVGAPNRRHKLRVLLAGRMLPEPPRAQVSSGTRARTPRRQTAPADNLGRTECASGGRAPPRRRNAETTSQLSAPASPSMGASGSWRSKKRTLERGDNRNCFWRAPTSRAGQPDLFISPTRAFLTRSFAGRRTMTTQNYARSPMAPAGRPNCPTSSQNGREFHSGLSAHSPRETKRARANTLAPVQRHRTWTSIRPAAGAKCK